LRGCLGASRRTLYFQWNEDFRWFCLLVVDLTGFFAWARCQWGQGFQAWSFRTLLEKVFCRGVAKIAEKRLGKLGGLRSQKKRSCGKFAKSQDLSKVKRGTTGRTARTYTGECQDRRIRGELSRGILRISYKWRDRLPRKNFAKSPIVFCRISRNLPKWQYSLQTLMPILA
jgi:hypothetical protein